MKYDFTELFDIKERDILADFGIFDLDGLFDVSFNELKIRNTKKYEFYFLRLRYEFIFNDQNFNDFLNKKELEFYIKILENNYPLYKNDIKNMYKKSVIEKDYRIYDGNESIKILGIKIPTDFVRFFKNSEVTVNEFIEVYFASKLYNYSEFLVHHETIFKIKHLVLPYIGKDMNDFKMILAKRGVVLTKDELYFTYMNHLRKFDVRSISSDSPIDEVLASINLDCLIIYLTDHYPTIKTVEEFLWMNTEDVKKSRFRLSFERGQMELALSYNASLANERIKKEGYVVHKVEQLEKEVELLERDIDSKNREILELKSFVCEEKGHILGSMNDEGYRECEYCLNMILDSDRRDIDLETSLVLYKKNNGGKLWKID